MLTDCIFFPILYSSLISFCVFVCARLFPSLSSPCEKPRPSKQRISDICTPAPPSPPPTPPSPPAVSANQMHTDSKLTNHGKQVNSGAQSQIPNVNQQQHQGPAGSLGSKGVGAGSHGAKPNQISPGNSGVKSGGVGGGVKGKAKRERSVSADAPDNLNPALEPDAKGGFIHCTHTHTHSLTHTLTRTHSHTHTHTHSHTRTHTHTHTHTHHTHTQSPSHSYTGAWCGHERKDNKERKRVTEGRISTMKLLSRSLSFSFTHNLFLSLSPSPTLSLSFSCHAIFLSLLSLSLSLSDLLQHRISHTDT